MTVVLVSFIVIKVFDPQIISPTRVTQVSAYENTPNKQTLEYLRW